MESSVPYCLFCFILTSASLFLLHSPEFISQMIELHLEVTMCVMKAASKRDNDNLSAVCPLPPLGSEHSLPCSTAGGALEP